MNINWLDIIVVLILGFSVYWGWKTGFTDKMSFFFSFVVALVFSFRFTYALADYIRSEYQWNITLILTRLAAFAMIFSLIFVLVHLFKLSWQKYGDATGFYDHIERLGGALIGLLKGILLSWAFLLFVLSLPWDMLHRELRENTVVASRMVMALPYVYDYLTESWHSPRISAGQDYVHRMSDQVEKKPSTRKKRRNND